MTENPESELRAAFSERASAITTEDADAVVARVTPGRKRRRLIVTTGVGSVTAAVAGVVLALSAGSPAYAGWTSSPSSPTSQDTAEVTSNCVPAITNASSSANSVASFDFPTDAGSWQVVLTDVRGPYVFAALSATEADGSLAGAMCLLGSDDSISVSLSDASHPGAFGYSSSGGSAGNQNLGVTSHAQSSSVATLASLLSATPPAADSATSPVIISGQDNATYVIGRAGSSVSGVTLQLADGSTVTASLQDRYYAAWWPGSVQPTSLVVTTSSGSTTNSFNSPANSTVKAPR